MNPASESVIKHIEASSLLILADELDKWAQSLAHMSVIDYGPSQIEGRLSFSVLMWKPARKPHATTH